MFCVFFGTFRTIALLLRLGGERVDSLFRALGCVCVSIRSASVGNADWTSPRSWKICIRFLTSGLFDVVIRAALAISDFQKLTAVPNEILCRLWFAE